MLKIINKNKNKLDKKNINYRAAKKLLEFYEGPPNLED